MTRTLHLRQRSIAHASLAAALLGCAALMIWPPATASFYPACPIHQLFGIDCPGCGATRAVAALLHGNFCEALRFNAFFVLLLPAALVFAVRLYRRALQPTPFRWPQPPAPALCALLTASAIFTLTRNIIH